MKDKIGIQTFTIRKGLKNLDDIEKTLSLYCEKGIKNFELSRITFSKEELILLKKLKEKYNITFFASQIPLKKIEDNLDFLLEFSNELNIKYLEVSVIPIMSFLKGKEGILKLCQRLNELGKKTKVKNVNLLYHHHNYELIQFEDYTYFKLLVENTNKDYVNFVCDTYWLGKSGYCPHGFIKKNINRIVGVHLRDNYFYFKRGKFVSKDTYLGNGTINFEEILKLDEESQIDFYSIEQDSEKPFEDIFKSYNYLLQLISKQ